MRFASCFVAENLAAESLDRRIRAPSPSGQLVDWVDAYHRQPAPLFAGRWSSRGALGMNLGAIILNHSQAVRVPRDLGDEVVVLNQRGNFKCPNGISAAGVAANVAIVKAKLPPVTLPKVPSGTYPKPDNFTFVVANLKQRGSARPRTLKTLTGTISSILPKRIAEAEIAAIIRKLQATGKVSVDEKKVSYAL
jgi:hypothetical protein